MNEGNASSGRRSFSIRAGYVPGAIGRIADLHARYYARHSGFGLYFESKVARELAHFCESARPERDGLWLALAGDDIVGSIAIDGAHASTSGAHLRWFIVADAMRGTGVGRALVAAALEFCDACDHPCTYLWTFAGLDAARHLYEKFGFALVEERPGSQWGAEVTEQRFERPKRAPFGENRHE